MKISKYLALGFLAISLTPVFGQQPPSTFQERLAAVQAANKEAADHAPALTKFNLDFPGGTPQELVAAIEKATGKPLNVIILGEDADAQLPPLKMNHVDVPQLFEALEAASQKVVSVVGPYLGSLQYQQQRTGYSFITPPGTLSDDSIWYFHVEKPSLPPAVSSEKICKFYPLSSYLESGLTVDDITTAIQTGWKMMNETSPPEISFHKETKLLIAVGEPDKLEVIDNVLKALQPQLPSPTFNDRLLDIIHRSPQSSVAPPTAPPRIMPPMPKSPENSLPDNKK